MLNPTTHPSILAIIITKLAIGYLTGFVLVFQLLM